jgi:hypothetical protein
MNYLVLVKTVVDDNGKRNVIEKIPYDGEVSLKSAYELIGCETIDIEEVPFYARKFRHELTFIPKMTFIFDDEFLLKHSKPVANELASLAFGYGKFHNQCLCGNVLLCDTNEEGESFPFDEDYANMVVKCLKRIGNHVDEVKFTVQQPMMTFKEF